MASSILTWRQSQSVQSTWWKHLRNSSPASVEWTLPSPRMLRLWYWRIMADLVDIQRIWGASSPRSMCPIWTHWAIHWMCRTSRSMDILLFSYRATLSLALTAYRMQVKSKEHLEQEDQLQRLEVSMQETFQLLLRFRHFEIDRGKTNSYNKTNWSKWLFEN